jgi:hypothetical protein
MPLGTTAVASLATGGNTMIDLLGRKCPDRPTIQFAMFNRELYLRERNGRYARAVLCRENDEKTTGEIDRLPQNKALHFRADNGKQYVLPLKYLTIQGAGDMLVIAVDEKAMLEHCPLYGLWESSYFANMQDD